MGPVNPSSSTFLPQNPYPNPNGAFAVPSNTNLKTTISLTEESLDAAESAIKSVCEFLQSSKTLAHDGFSSCPFNSSHRMPAESLFRHSLVCSSSPGIVDLCILDPLRYPNTLKLPLKDRCFTPLGDSKTDLCFSLDEFGDFGSNFFYKDCPGVVGSVDQCRTFILPGVLSVECANFASISDRQVENSWIFPSELWALRRQIQLWNDYPLSYSYTVLRVCSLLRVVSESDIKKWMISNSPRYGVTVDIWIRDHIFILLKLCLKAISREAFSSLEFFVGGNGCLNPDNVTFKCPHLVEVFTWLALQFSVLYGEANGKHFAIDMLKQCLLSASLGSLLIPLEQKQSGSSGNVGSGSFDLEVSGNREQEGFNAESSISVLQVAAAIAALHERASLEERIKELRFGRPFLKTQLLDEHLHASTRAIEERGKRPDYRPILEHDGLLWQSSHNQDSNKSKTREELLAEERDYKRRRMSYRGKKAKRSTTQVIRDIIEVHMEEIKQAGGIGCFVKGAVETGSCPSEPISIDIAPSVDKLKASAYESFETSQRKSLSYGNETFARLEDDFPKFQLSKRTVDRDEQAKSRSIGLESFGSHSHSRERNSHSRERNRHQMDPGDFPVKRNVFEKKGSASSDQSKYLGNDPDMDKSDRYRTTRGKDRHRERTSMDRRSESRRESLFEDRYDPSGSYERYEETSNDVSFGRKYVRPETLSSPSNDDKHHKEPQKSGYSSKRHHCDHRRS